MSSNTGADSQNYVMSQAGMADNVSFGRQFGNGALRFQPANDESTQRVSNSTQSTTQNVKNQTNTAPQYGSFNGQDWTQQMKYPSAPNSHPVSRNINPSHDSASLITKERNYAPPQAKASYYSGQRGDIGVDSKNFAPFRRVQSVFPDMRQQQAEYMYQVNQNQQPTNELLSMPQTTYYTRTPVTTNYPRISGEDPQPNLKRMQPYDPFVPGKVGMDIPSQFWDNNKVRNTQTMRQPVPNTYSVANMMQRERQAKHKKFLADVTRPDKEAYKKLYELQMQEQQRRIDFLTNPQVQSSSSSMQNSANRQPVYANS